MSISVSADQKTIYLSGGNTSYVLHIDDDRRLVNLHWGARIEDGSLSYSPSDYYGGASFDTGLSRIPLDIPCCGNGWYGTPAVGVRNPHGDDVTDLRVVSFRLESGKPPLPGLPASYVESPSEADTLIVKLSDDWTGLQVDALYSVYNRSGIIARSLNIRNTGACPLTLTSVLSASVLIWESSPDLIHLKGSWARERAVVRTSAGEAEYRISSARGASGHEENPFIAICRKNTDEFSGCVWAMNLVYSGSFQALCKTDNGDRPRLSIGLNPEVFSWKLEPGESFQSPEAILVFSDRGLNGMSQAFHSLYRTRLVRGAWRDRSRPVLINNWEGTYFNFTEKRLLAIAEKAKEIGIELFVLDDGWFGRRNSDNCSLGDWTVNRRKLPSGLSGLSDRIHAMGLQFGLWFEPEMVSPDSRLYRSHPDWCLHVPGRQRTEARNQLILDLSRTEVQDYIISSVSSVLSSARIDYVKWDMNRNMTEAFSEALPADRRPETQHRYMLGLYRVLEIITSAFPDILFESCSGGGGRFDAGMLFYMPQTWTSDDTDAVERLKIQYGTSFVYPASSMGAHVSAVPNHQTGRITPMRTRGEVAMGGNFGFELDLAKLSPQDLVEAADLVRRVKEIRDLTRTGTFWRLLSPFDGMYTAWSFVSEDQRNVLLCTYRSLSSPNSSPLRLRLSGLNPSLCYKNEEDGTIYHGSALMNAGLTVCLDGDFSSRVFRFSAL